MSDRDFKTVAAEIVRLLPDECSAAKRAINHLIEGADYQPPENHGYTLWLPLSRIVRGLCGPGWTPQDPVDLWKLDITSVLAGRDVRLDPPRPEPTTPPTIYDWKAIGHTSTTFGCDVVGIVGREHHGGKITTSPVVALDLDTKTITTLSGTLYQLDGEVWPAWLLMPSPDVVRRLKAIKAIPRQERGRLIRGCSGPF